MKLSTTTRYGLRALSDLCAQGGEGPVAVSDIARRQDIPANYLEQLFARLRRGDILRSVRGAQGGYLLARPAGEITVAEIVDALGETITFGDCQTEAGCDQIKRHLLSERENQTLPGRCCSKVLEGAEGARRGERPGPFGRNRFDAEERR